MLVPSPHSTTPPMSRSARSDEEMKSYAVRDEAYNNRVVLKEVLGKLS